MSINQEPQMPTAEELARNDLITLGAVVAASHPNSKLSPAEALEPMWRPELDYKIGRLSDHTTPPAVAYAGAIMYACNRFEDASSQQLPGGLEGAEIAADILDYTKRLNETNSYRRTSVLRRIRTELEVKRILALGEKKREGIIADSVSEMNAELGQHNREVAVTAGAVLVAAGTAITWWRRRS